MTALLRSDRELSSSICCILSDVDGVMTDGRIIYDSAGNETKQFHARDGLGIKKWMEAGFHFGIVTARNSPMVQRRADELGIEHVCQGSSNKLTNVMRIVDQLGIQLSQVCYLGDDLPDLGVLQRCGLPVAPADAAIDAREAAQWVLRSAGGHGAVREAVERLMRAKKCWRVNVD